MGLPVVRFSDINNETCIASPLSQLWFNGSGSEGFNRSEVVEIPCLANGEGSIRILLGFMHAHAARFPHGNDNDTGLF